MCIKRDWVRVAERPMSDRTLIASATNLLARGYLVVPTDRQSRAGEPVNGLFAVARAIQRVVAFKQPARAVAVLVGDRVWWYDANKDVRYTPEIVTKRFTVAPDKVAEWLALVGDDDAVPGVAGIGAKGATVLLESYGTIAGALAQLDAIGGRT